MEVIDSGQYQFEVHASTEQTGAVITLLQEPTGRTKIFFLAGHTAPFTGLEKHMRSLTETLCDSWFKGRETTKKKAK